MKLAACSALAALASSVATFYATPRGVELRPPADVRAAMAHGFECWAEYKPSMPKPERIEWLCR